MADEARIDALTAERDRLEARVLELEAAMGLTFLAPLEWGLTGNETRLFGALMARELLTKEAAMTALYRDVGADDEPEIRIIDVMVCKMRPKLKPFGIEIVTRWGVGYQLTADVKAGARAQIEAAA